MPEKVNRAPHHQEAETQSVGLPPVVEVQMEPNITISTPEMSAQLAIRTTKASTPLVQAIPNDRDAARPGLTTIANTPSTGM